jgi:hypothetical protein
MIFASYFLGENDAKIANFSHSLHTDAVLVERNAKRAKDFKMRFIKNVNI